MELQDKIEIVISDNASHDGTKEIVMTFKNKIKNLVYYCWDYNVGFDRNLVKVVELARGKYCWLMGSDDLLTNDSIHQIYEKIKKDIHDIIIFDRIEMNSQMTDQIGSSSPIKKRQILTIDTKNKKQLKRYLKLVNNLMGFFSYISCLIFKKERWNSIKNYEKFYGSEYIHLYFLWTIVNNGAILSYINKPYVKTRMFDERQAELGLLFRVQTDNTAFKYILKNTLTDKKIYNLILNKVILFTVAYPILFSKLNKYPVNTSWKIFLSCLKYYWNYQSFWIKSLPILILPKFSLKILYDFYKKYK